MKITLVHDHFEQDHLDHVIEEMKTLGAPTVKAVWLDYMGSWAALEGCHRLRAAEALGLTPEIEPIEYDDVTTVQDFGLDYEDDFRVCEIVDGAYARHTLEFAE